MSKFTILSKIAPLYNMTSLQFGNLLKNVGLRNADGLVSSLGMEKGIGENKKHPEQKYYYQIWHIEKLQAYLRDDYGIPIGTNRFKFKSEIKKVDTSEIKKPKFDRLKYEEQQKTLNTIEDEDDDLPF